jgi:hypothetical protein
MATRLAGYRARLGEVGYVDIKQIGISAPTDAVTDFVDCLAVAALD